MPHPNSPADEPTDSGATGDTLAMPARDEIEADEAQTERQAPNQESPGLPASTDQ